MFKWQVNTFGDKGVLISWDKQISSELHEYILDVRSALHRLFGEEIIESVPAYQSLALFLKYDIDTLAFIQKLETWSRTNSKDEEKVSRHFKIPVCFDDAYSADLDLLCAQKGISREDGISIFIKPVYHVYFLGFLPGFPYLGTLPELLHTPRRSTPRSVVPSGSIAIGGRQTGIYPFDSPGGWNIIGRTPISIFRNNRSLFVSGDKISFYSVNSQLFNELEILDKREAIDIKYLFHD